VTSSTSAALTWHKISPDTLRDGGPHDEGIASSMLAAGALDGHLLRIVFFKILNCRLLEKPTMMVIYHHRLQNSGDDLDNHQQGWKSTVMGSPKLAVMSNLG